MKRDVTFKAIRIGESTAASAGTPTIADIIRACHPDFFPERTVKGAMAKAKSIAEVVRSKSVAIPPGLVTQMEAPMITRADIERCKASPNHGDLNGAIRAISAKYREATHEK